jgi:hypothetical protein
MLRGWNPMDSLKVYKFGHWMRNAGDEGLESHGLLKSLKIQALDAQCWG